jgi:hypothetical protein
MITWLLNKTMKIFKTTQNSNENGDIYGEHDTCKHSVSQCKHSTQVDPCSTSFPVFGNDVPGLQDHVTIETKPL